MKKIILSFLILMSSLYAQESKQKLVFAADDWCPYNCDDKDRPGYMFELVKEALNVSGRYELTFKIMGWSRSIKLVEEGKITGVLGGSVDDFEGLKTSKVPIGYSGGCFYTREGEDKWNFTGLKSLEGRVVGWVQDYAWTEEFDQWIETAKKDPKKVFVITGDDPYTRLKSLLGLKRIDTFGEDDNVWAYLTKDEKVKYGNAGCEPYNTKIDNLLVGFSASEKDKQKTDDIINDLDQGLNKIIGTEAELKILKSYGLVGLKERHKNMLLRTKQGWRPDKN